MKKVPFKKLDKWLKRNRYQYVHVAKHFGVTKTAVSLWKSRDSIPQGYVPDIEKIMSGKIKLATITRVN